jgi:hypothetical protein
LAKIALWKILVQLFLGWFSWYSNTGSAGHSTGFSLVETGSADFKTGSAGFYTVHFILRVCCVSHNFLKTGSTGFCAEKSKTASFGAPPIYTHSYLSHPQKSMTWTPFLT